MITCKICEKQTLSDRLADHSKVCREVTILYEQLHELRSNMGLFADKAATMKNSLEIYAVQQKYLIEVSLRLMS